MKSREGCCADIRKPCSYHEGYEDGVASKTVEAIDAIVAIREERDSLTAALREIAAVGPQHGKPVVQQHIQDIAVTALAALDKPKGKPCVYGDRHQRIDGKCCGCGIDMPKVQP